MWLEFLILYEQTAACRTLAHATKQTSGIVDHVLACIGPLVFLNRTFNGFAIGICVLVWEKVGETRGRVTRVLQQHSAGALNTHSQNLEPPKSCNSPAGGAPQ